MARPRQHNKPWTAGEITLLKAHYRKGTLHREIAKALRRTLNAVESKAMELKISSKRRRK